MPVGWAFAAPVAMLFGSNLLMNLAWYGHLKGQSRALWLAVLVSWGLAFFEYCLAVPANELKAIQEVLSLTTFVLLAWVLFDQRPGVSQIIGFALIAAGAYVIFKGPFG